MKTRLLLTIFALTAFLSPRLDPIIPAFPGAEGFGAQTVGGRGGAVYVVSNTNDSGTGSLRACVEASGPRTCVFSVGGLITLASPLIISNPYITIAGQTAPGGGITIRLGAATEAISTQTHDVIIRYLTVRSGPGGENHTNQIALNGTALYNVIVDHNSLSWGVDSNIETWYRVYNTTLSWNIVSEALDCSTHIKGCHSKGLMIGGYQGSESGGIGSENISLLNNLLAHNADRNPLMQLCGTAQVMNNITYNPMYTFSHQQLNCVDGASYVNWINNYHKSGPDSTSSNDLKFIPSDSGVCELGYAYMSGNRGASGTWVYGYNGDCVGHSIVVGTPATAPAVQTTDYATTYTTVLADAGNNKGVDCNGNWYGRQDTIDARVISDVQNGTGSIIDNPSEVGGWVTPATGTPCVDTDSDGIPNAWEVAHNLNPAVQDSNETAPSGYTWLEDYINGQDGIVTDTHSIPLEQGWNLVSFRVRPIDSSTEAVLASVAGNFNQVYSWDGETQAWKSFIASLPPYTRTLLNLTEKMGFWINMLTADTLEVYGIVPEATEIPIYTGWNMIGFPSDSVVALPGALDDLYPDLIIVYAYHANTPEHPWVLYDPTMPPFLVDLTEMESGWGYWVRSAAPHTLIVDY